MKRTPTKTKEDAAHKKADEAFYDANVKRMLEKARMEIHDHIKRI